MTARPTKGGRVPPDGRPSQAKGVGRDAKRHDLELPATPGLHDSDLQSGDVQRLTQAQRVSPRPKRNQPPAQPGARRRRSGGAAPQSDQRVGAVPDPMELAKERLGGTLGGPPSQLENVDIGKWVPLLQQLTRTPGSGGVLRSAVINQISNLARKPVTSTVSVLDVQDLESQAADFLGVS